VVAEVALALLKLLYTFAHLEVRLHTNQATRTTTVALNGSATFVKLPRLAAALESIPAGMNVRFYIDRLSYIDHACLDLIANWRKQHMAREGQVELPWDDLQRRYHERNAAVLNDPPRTESAPPKVMAAGGRG
jgi:MFS superfamily sulfate permease-like transporter